MISIKTKDDIRVLAKAGAINAFALRQVARHARPGVRCGDLEKIALRVLRARGAEPSFLGYKGYRFALCVSIGDEVVHGLPNNRVIKHGDVVGIDLGVKYLDRYTDAALSFQVGGRANNDVKRLLEGTREALDEAVETTRPGVAVGDVEAATGAILKKYRLSPITALSGHGVGFGVHEEPSIKSDGKAGEGARLEEGMVLALEPMACLGAGKVKVSPDGWTVKTEDGSPGAHFEQTIVLERTGSRILTPLPKVC